MLRSGGVVAMRSDTVYGLFARADSSPAIQRIFDIKGRIATKGLPVLIADSLQLNKVAVVDPGIRSRLESIWPTALTVIVPAKFDLISPVATGQQDSVALRCPDSFRLRHMIEILGVPLVATSANLSGNAECRSAQAVILEFSGRSVVPDGVFDSGEVPLDVLPSTIIDLTSSEPRLIRAGGWTGDISLFSRL